jgi:hypothetical protein
MRMIKRYYTVKRDIMLDKFICIVYTSNEDRLPEDLISKENWYVRKRSYCIRGTI